MGQEPGRWTDCGHQMVLEMGWWTDMAVVLADLAGRVVGQADLPWPMAGLAVGHVGREVEAQPVEDRDGLKGNHKGIENSPELFLFVQREKM